MTLEGTLYVTGDPDADGLLCSDANALVIGMLLVQQVPLEWAFRGPHSLRERLGHLEPARFAAMDEDAFVAVCCEKPAIHRFPAAMGRRVQAMCAALVADHGGSAETLWADAPDGPTLAGRLRALPGFGPEKTKIFVAVLAKRFGVRPDGWEAAAGGFAMDDGVPRSVADVTDPSVLAAIREHRATQKAAKGSVDKES